MTNKLNFTILQKIFVEIEFKTFLEIDKSKCKSKSVTTDLKKEYRKPIDKLIMDHQFHGFNYNKR